MLKFDNRLRAVGPIPSLASSFSHSVLGSVYRARPHVVAWWFFAGCFVALNIPHLSGELSGPLSYALTVCGSGGCAWAWLFSRSLFRPTKSVELWPFMAVAGIVAVESFWEISRVLNIGGWSGEVSRILGNAASLVCISALFLVFIEALSGYSDRMAQKERRFRQTFIFVYGVLIVVSMLWASNAIDGTFVAYWRDAVIVACGLAGVVAGRMAVSFRERNPLPNGAAPSGVKVLTSTSANNDALARRILTAMKDEKIYATPNLKVADFSKMIGEHDYKVTQCITGVLQYPNFNRLINIFRIERAKEALLDPHAKDQPILSIAFDCGFNSIGPFNRAFKQEVGMTPREFRALRETGKLNRLSQEKPL